MADQGTFENLFGFTATKSTHLVIYAEIKIVYAILSELSGKINESMSERDGVTIAIEKTVPVEELRGLLEAAKKAEENVKATFQAFSDAKESAKTVFGNRIKENWEEYLRKA
jgi:hypothetical protein